MKLLSLIVPLTLVSGILAGCSSMAPTFGTKSATPAPTAASAASAAAVPADTTPDIIMPVDRENLPHIPLTDEIFFKVISAEIAFQRSDFPAAYATTMAVSQETKDSRLSKRALEMALLAKQPAQAFYAAKIWFEQAPESEEALQYYVGFLILNNSYEEVQSILAESLKQASPRERAVLLLRTERELMRASNKEAAFNVMEQLCKPYPDYPEAHLAMAQAAFSTNNSVRAMAEAQAALKLAPDSQIAILTVAQVSASPADALNVLADFLKSYPKSLEARRAYAGLLIEQKQYVQARSQFDILLAAKPGDAGMTYTMGVLALQLNDIGAGEKYLKSFVVMAESTPGQPDLTSAYLYLSQIADDRGDGVAAMDWLAKVQSYDGKNAAYFNAQLRRAFLIAKYKTLPEALEFVHQIKATPTEQIQLIQLEAELLRNANEDSAALALLQEAVKDHADNPELLYDFAMVAEKFDQVQEMEQALRKVIALNPKNQQAYNALGYSLADRNLRLPEARSLIEKALTLAPDDAFIIDSMGWLEFRENKNAESLVHLQRAYALRPDAEIGVHLGEVLWTMGEHRKARAIWREARRKDPKNAALKSTLERLKVNL